MSDIADFGQMISAFGGGGDRGNMFPQSDADDFSNGARFIPGEVTLARRAGRVVKFIQTCGACCWYWKFDDGMRVYHFDPITRDRIDGDVCPDCGNEHTGGGTVEADPEHPEAPEVTNTTSNPVDAMGGLFTPPSVGVPAMEARGQSELINSTKLPVQGSNNPEILAMGITFGDVTPGDDLFREATLPEGWKKEGSDHAMWSYIVDDEGTQRVAIFYKAAFYDRDAFMRPV